MGTHLTLETVEAEDVCRYKAISSGAGAGKTEAGSLGAWSRYLCESAVTVVSFKSKGRQGRERSIKASAADKKKFEQKKITFYDVLNERFRRGHQYASRRDVVQHTLQDFARDMIVEGSKNTAKFPSGK